MKELAPRVFIFLSLILLVVGCSQIQPHPDFWNSRRVKKLSVEKTKIAFEAIQIDHDLPAPSFALSEWTILTKSRFATREYRLVLRDQTGKLIDSHNPPELIIDGPAKLISLSKMSPATWKVSFEYFYDPAIVKLGLKLGTHRIEYFRQIQYQLHELDFMESKTYTQKTKVRADGVDKLRVHVTIRDKQGYNIFSTNDFQLNLLVDDINAKVAGPFSAFGGPYFEISSLTPGPIKYSVEIDGESLQGQGVAHFIAFDRRAPASEKRNCLTDLAQVAGIPVPETEPLLAYQQLARRILAIFEENQDTSSERFQFVLDAFSSQSCTSNAIWDAAREEAGRELRVIHRRISR
jgi:hypothetical protein